MCRAIRLGHEVNEGFGDVLDKSGPCHSGLFLDNRGTIFSQFNTPSVKQTLSHVGTSPKLVLRGMANTQDAPAHDQTLNEKKPGFTPVCALRSIHRKRHIYFLLNPTLLIVEKK